MLADMEASLFTYNIEHGWIIDMVRVNTSHQICPYLLHINQLLTPPPCYITIPNGKRAQGMHIGRIKIGPK